MDFDACSKHQRCQTTATLIAKNMEYYDRPVAWLTRRNINSALVPEG
jgi:hypothetical protein